jgi:FkbM family methyltransferase
MSITIQNTIIKSDGLIKKWRQDPFNVRKILSVMFLMLKRFFREYLPLKFMGQEVIKEIQGSKMILNLNDLGISRELACYGVHEKNSTEEVKKIIKKGMKILEIGANIGYYALLETKLAGNTGHLYALEPSPINYTMLSRNLALNKVKNATIYPYAGGSVRTQAKFLLSGKGNLSSFISRTDLNGEEIDVQVFPIKDLITDKVDFIRMDVEGYEDEILKGIDFKHKPNKPKYFFIEVHSELVKGGAEGIVHFMSKRGYEVRKGFWRGSNVQVNSVNEMLRHPNLNVGYWETFFELK